MNKLILIPIIALIFVLIDWYVFQAVQIATNGLTIGKQRIVNYVFWGLTAVSIISLFVYHFMDPEMLGRHARTFIMTGIFMNYFSKILVVIFLLIDDISRVFRWAYQEVSALFIKEPLITETTTDTPVPLQEPITRSEFLSKTGLVIASVPVIGMSYGIISGAHDYRVRRITVKLPNLPKSFHGIKLAQLSDIHSGSFFNKTAVKGGVEMLMKEKPDLLFFTGDLVNNKATEVKDYIDIFGKLDAPLGVYSTLGNHDYGDYVQWESEAAKVKNLQDLMQAHKLMGWNLLMNENKIIEQGGEQLAIIGIENWGAKARFPKYGRLAEARKGTENAPVKLLLSHDPSHWDAQVRPEFPDIDIMFAGHTHGMQCGVEIGNIKWSPVQYMYDQWAGLYQQGHQYLYVNRGFGYLGFPGRIGMLPEITIMTLERG